jgi:hypothetical protein
MINIPESFLSDDGDSEPGPFETKEDGPVRIEIVGIPEFKVQSVMKKQLLFIC